MCRFLLLTVFTGFAVSTCSAADPPQTPAQLLQAIKREQKGAGDKLDKAYKAAKSAA